MGEAMGAGLQGLREALGVELLQVCVICMHMCE